MKNAKTERAETKPFNRETAAMLPEFQTQPIRNISHNLFLFPVLNYIPR